MKTLRNVFPKPACYRGKVDNGLAKLRVTEKGDGRLASYHYLISVYSRTRVKSQVWSLLFQSIHFLSLHLGMSLFDSFIRKVVSIAFPRMPFPNL